LPSLPIGCLSSIPELQRMPSSVDAAGRPGFAYQPIDTGDGSVLLKRASSSSHQRVPRAHRGCIDTHGHAFNLVVGIVLCANAVFLCLEADLDLLSVESLAQPWSPGGADISLGPDGLPGGHSKRWGGLESDMGLVGINGDQQADVEDGIQQGLKADQGIKATLQQEVKSMDIKDVNVQSLQSGAYNAVEFVFVAFFVLEFLFRLCDVGCGDYWRCPWSLVDVVVVVAGLVDLALPIMATVSTDSITEQVLRLLRVLRILRLFRVCAALRTVGKAFVNALHAIMWIFALIAIINLICAIFLTTFLGQRAQLWNEHAEQVYTWFGSIGRSMVTLSTIMTLSGWDHIAEVLVTRIPRLVVMSVIFAYILICGFTILGLVVGMINTTLISSQLEEDKRHAHRCQEKRAAFAGAFTDILATCEQSKNGYLSRDEFIVALECHPIVFTHLKTLDIDTSIDGLLHLYDRLSQDVSFDGAIEIVHLVEAMLHLSGAANALGVFDLKYHFIGLRRDHKKQVADVSRELGAKHEISAAATGARVDDLQHKVESMQRELSTVVKALSTIGERLEVKYNAEEKDRGRQHQAIESTNSKLDGLFAQLNSTLFSLTSRVATQSTVIEKVENLSKEVAAQAAVKDRIHAIAVELHAGQTSVHEKVDGLSARFMQQAQALLGGAKGVTEVSTASVQDENTKKEMEASARSTVPGNAGKDAVELS